MKLKVTSEEELHEFAETTADILKNVILKMQTYLDDRGAVSISQRNYWMEKGIKHLNSYRVDMQSDGHDKIEIEIEPQNKETT